MKNIKSAVALLIAILLIFTSLPIITFASSNDYLEYIDFGSDYADNGWRYFTTGGDGKTSVVNAQMQFAGNTNSGNSFDNRAILLTNSRTTPKIQSDSKYRIVFDVIVPASEFANLTSQIKFYTVDGLWYPVSGAPTITDKLSTLQLVSSKVSGTNTVYTLSKELTAPTLGSNCNLALSVYGTGSGSTYYVDNVYVYGANEYTLVDENDVELGKIYGFPGEDIAQSLKGTELEKFGYNISVNPTVYPDNSNEKIVLSYSGKANLVTGIDFGVSYAKGEKNDYVPSSSSYVLWADGKIKFNDTSAASVDFADRAILLNNDVAKSTVKSGKKYRLTLEFISWSDISEYTLELKYGTTLGAATHADTFTVDGATLETYVKSQETLADNSKVYVVEFDVTTPANGSFENILISLYGSTHIYLDSALISKFYTYNVEDTDGNELGTITAFAGDKVMDVIAGTDFIIEDYKCEVKGSEFFPEDPDEKIVLKYTEITNVLQYIDFGDSYAKNDRDASGVPNWRYYTPGLVKLQNEAAVFAGSINSGKTFGDRGLLLANSRSTYLIQANKRYELQFELWLKSETLDSKNVDIQLGSQVWDAKAYKNEKASSYKLVSTRTDGIYTVYTLSQEIISTTNTNVLISVYGTGSANDVILDNVYIFEEYSYLCVDENGNEVGHLPAFPGEKLSEILPGSEVDKKGFFEATDVKTAPLKSSQKITITYTEDPSFIDYIDFSSSYAGGVSNWHYYTSSVVNWTNQQMSFPANITSGKAYGERAVLLSNVYTKKLAKANKNYIIQFDLWLQGDALSSKTVDIRLDDYVWASSNPTELCSKTADKFTIEKTKTQGAYTIYTLSVNVLPTKDSNFLISVYGNGTGKAAIVDNVEIAVATKVVLANTNLADLVGRIGYKLTLPTDILKKGYIFEGWYKDADFEDKFTKTKFAETNITAYAKFIKVDTEAEMTFTLPPSSAANLTGFKHNLLTGNISAATTNSGIAYLNMFASGDAIRISPASTYPVYFKYKTDNLSGKITFGIASASKSDFNKANNIIATVTVNVTNNEWANASLCATPDIITEGSTRGDYLYFFVKFEGDSDGKIYVDNIELRQETSFTFDTNGGNSIDAIKGEPGASVTLPTPTNGSKTFSGWYYDSALTSKVESLNVTYPTAKCNIKLYAGWDIQNAPVMVENFESYNTSLINDAANQRAKEVFSISSNFAYKGNTSLHYEYDPENSKLLSEKESTVKLTGNSGASGNGIVIESGKTYVMTLYVYAKTLDSRVDIQLGVADQNNINTNYKLQTASVGAARINDKFTTENTWQKVEYVFTGATAVATSNELFLSVRTITETYTELYIDNVSIKELASDMGAIAFDDSFYRETLADLEYKYIVGKVGEKISFPSGIRENYKLLGWYNQYTYAKEFSKEFEAGAKTAHAKWDIEGTVIVDFENSGHYSQDGVGTDKTWSYTLINGSKVVSGEKASSGTSAIKIDAKDPKWRNDTKAIALKDVDSTAFRLVDNTTYIISIDVYVEEYTGNFSFWFATGSQDNYYAWQGTTSGKMIVNEDVETGKWITTTMTYSTAFSSPGGFNLFLCTTNQKGMKVYFDNIKIQSIDPENITVVMNTGLVGGSTQTISGKLGDEYTLPTSLNIPGYAFIGWYNSPSLERTVDFEDYFTVTRTVYAKLVPKTIVQNFEGSTLNFENLIGGDKDYEIYSLNSPNFDHANVHDGSYSLHRKGDSYQFNNAMLVSRSAQLSPGDVYEVTMWVKMDKYDHTNGAIKLGSCSSSQFAWDLTDEMKAVVAIKDLTDKKWHKVTFNFMASAYYLAIQTPGYCSIYIDDITIKYLGSAVPSEEVEYTEYLPIEKDENGKIPEVTPETKEEILDSRLEVYSRLNELQELYGDYSETITNTKKSVSVERKRNPLTFMDILTCNSYVWYTVVFYASVGALIAVAAAIVIIIAIRKKRKGRM